MGHASAKMRYFDLDQRAIRAGAVQIEHHAERTIKLFQHVVGSNFVEGVVRKRKRQLVEIDQLVRVGLGPGVYICNSRAA